MKEGRQTVLGLAGSIVTTGVLGVVLSGGALAPPLHSHTAAAKWLVVHAARKTVKLTLISAYNNVNNGYNFDGYANGTMVVTIPVGWTVHVT
jgi:hypothetical protein